jgi:Xaa-Pro dipeptidase
VNVCVPLPVKSVTVSEVNVNVLPFSKAEYASRIERVQKSMQRCQLDALVVTAPPNYRYFTGYDTQFWESPARPWFLVIPSSGESIAVVPEIGEPVVATYAVGSIRTWPAPRPQDEGVSLLSSTLKELPRRFGRIGFELGRESVLRMPVSDFFQVQKNLGSIELVDGSPCIWEVRNIKSRAEIEMIRTSGQIVSRSFEALPGFARKGMTEAEVCRQMTVDIIQRGAHAVPFLACASGEGGYPEIISRPKARELVEGDVLIIDVGATTHGYFCDFDRNYAIGKISDAAAKAHDAVWLATEAGIGAARPGTRVKDLWRVMMDVMEPAGMRGNNVGRLGHGLGLQLTEPPSNSADDDAVLEAGMVITIEPGMEYAPGKMIVHEENIAITADGAELLTTRAPREMLVVG